MGSVYRRGKVWWLKYYVDGRALYESEFFSDRSRSHNMVDRS